MQPQGTWEEGSGALTVRGLRVLIVDDADECNEAFAELLSALGHTVRVARRGKRAVELLRAEPADLVFVDLDLPDMKAQELAMEVRAACGGANCRLIALSGFRTSRALQAALPAGCDGIIVKGFDVEGLRRYVPGWTEVAGEGNA